MTRKPKYQAHVTVTKIDDNNFNVNFLSPVSGTGKVGKAKSNEEVPVEWLRSALDYYMDRRETDGSLNDEDRKRVEALW